MKKTKKLQVMRCIRQYMDQYQRSPTQYELSKLLSIPRSTIYHHIQYLMNNGFIKVNYGVKRGIELIDPAIYLQLFVRGSVTAGVTSEKVLDKHEALNLSDLVVGKDKFVLKVEGNSMSGDNIFCGDYVICEDTSSVKKDQIAVVCINDEATTLKRVHYTDQGTKVTLLSSNPDIDPLVYPKNSIKIKGIYVGLLRLSDSLNEGNG